MGFAAHFGEFRNPSASQAHRHRLIAWYTVGIESMPRPLLGTQQPQIGHLIRDLRQQLNLSQEKFAAYLGVSFHQV